MAKQGNGIGHLPGFAYSFYISDVWRTCREGYLKSRGGLCERCAAKGLIVPATQVHHKVRLTPDNIKNPEISCGWDNLEALCDACHQEEHKKAIAWRTDAYGRVQLDPP